MTGAGAAPPEPSVVLIDPEILDLVPGYLANRARDVVHLRALVAANQMAEVSRLGHSMKGSGGGYGFEAITGLGSEIEQAAVAGDGARILRALDRLADYLARVRFEGG